MPFLTCCSKLTFVASIVAALAVAIAYQGDTLRASGLQLVSLAITWKAYLAAMLQSDSSSTPVSPSPSLFDLKAVAVGGELVDLSRYRGNVVLVINVASQCGFTDSSYQRLVELHGRYQKLGFEIFAFPCDQFGGQEPESNAQIKKFVEKEYGVRFPIFAKSEVNGDSTNDVFKFLKSFFPGDVPWNFHGIWLVDRDGIPQARLQIPNFHQVEAKLRSMLAGVSIYDPDIGA